MVAVTAWLIGVSVIGSKVAKYGFCSCKTCIVRKTNVPTALGDPAKGSFLMLGKPNSHAMQLMKKKKKLFFFFFPLSASTATKIQLAECTRQYTYD